MWLGQGNNTSEQSASLHLTGLPFRSHSTVAQAHPTTGQVCDMPPLPFSSALAVMRLAARLARLLVMRAVVLGPALGGGQRALAQLRRHIRRRRQRPRRAEADRALQEEREVLRQAAAERAAARQQRLAQRQRVQPRLRAAPPTPAKPVRNARLRGSSTSHSANACSRALAPRHPRASCTQGPSHGNRRAAAPGAACSQPRPAHWKRRPRTVSCLDRALPVRRSFQVTHQSSWYPPSKPAWRHTDTCAQTQHSLYASRHTSGCASTPWQHQCAAQQTRLLGVAAPTSLHLRVVGLEVV